MEDKEIKRGRNEKGQFTENNTGKPKGAKNKERLAGFTQKQQVILMRVLDNHMQYLDKALERMTDKERYDTIAKFYKYMMPIRSNVQVEADVSGDINIVVKHQKTQTEEPKERLMYDEEEDYELEDDYEEEGSDDIELILPEPHPGQQKVIDSQSKVQSFVLWPQMGEDFGLSNHCHIWNACKAEDCLCGA